MATRTVYLWLVLVASCSALLQSSTCSSGDPSYFPDDALEPFAYNPPPWVRSFSKMDLDTPTIADLCKETDGFETIPPNKIVFHSKLGIVLLSVFGFVLVVATGFACFPSKIAVHKHVRVLKIVSLFLSAVILGCYIYQIIAVSRLEYTPTKGYGIVNEVFGEIRSYVHRLEHIFDEIQTILDQNGLGSNDVDATMQGFREAFDHILDEYRYIDESPMIDKTIRSVKTGLVAATTVFLVIEVLRLLFFRRKISSIVWYRLVLGVSVFFLLLSIVATVLLVTLTGISASACTSIDSMASVEGRDCTSETVSFVITCGTDPEARRCENPLNPFINEVARNIEEFNNHNLNVTRIDEYIDTMENELATLIGNMGCSYISYKIYKVFDLVCRNTGYHVYLISSIGMTAVSCEIAVLILYAILYGSRSSKQSEFKDDIEAMPLSEDLPTYEDSQAQTTAMLKKGLAPRKQAPRVTTTSSRIRYPGEKKKRSRRRKKHGGVV